MSCVKFLHGATGQRGKERHHRHGFLDMLPFFLITVSPCQAAAPAVAEVWPTDAACVIRTLRASSEGCSAMIAGTRLVGDPVD